VEDPDPDGVPAESGQTGRECKVEVKEEKIEIGQDREGSSKTKWE